MQDTTTGTTTEFEKTDQLQRFSAAAGRVITFFVYAYVMIVEVILGLGFVLLLFGANPSSSFVEWVYRSVGRAMKPFRGIFEPIELGVTGNDVSSIVDTSVLFAMIIYGIIGVLLSSLLHWLTQRINRIDTTNAQRAADYERRALNEAYLDTLRAQQPVPPASMPAPNPDARPPGGVG